jgi:anti-sigma regulatory factor (Ser/Thr protein kinase)
MEIARLELPATPAAAGVARLFVRCLCEEWGVGGVAEVAELLSSELVTNAVLHAHTSVELCAAWQDDGALRVEVFDSAADAQVTPAHRNADPAAESGRGLAIVANLASSWGVDAVGGGKSVWFTLSAIP